jgi:RNA polymerase sigma factor (sigma-70 family)
MQKKHPEEYGYRFNQCETPIRNGQENDKLAREWCESRDPAIRERLIICNRRLVGFISSQYKLPPNIEKRDVIGESFVGLIRAIDKYDSGRGSFVPWALRIMGAHIRQYLTSARLIKVPYDLVREVLDEDTSKPAVNNHNIKHTRQVIKGILPIKDVEDPETKRNGQEKIERLERINVLNTIWDNELEDNERDVLLGLYLHSRRRTNRKEVGRILGMNYHLIKVHEKKALEKISEGIKLAED